jgi:RHS repeat-associated protein
MHTAPQVEDDHVVGSNERIETMRYNQFGQLAEHAGAGAYPLTFGYDLAGNRTTMTDGNQSTTTWEFDALNRVTRKLYADGKDAAYTYDGAGNLLSRRDGKQQTTAYLYNAYQQPTLVDYPTNPDVSFAYDRLGRRTTLTRDGTVTGWSYDPAGRLQSEQQGEVGKTVAYAYDLEGHRTAMNVTGVPTDAAPDWQTQYSYDEAGRLELLLDPRISATDPFRYTWKDNANLLTAISTPLGGATTKSYDFGGRLTNISATHGSTAINSYSYSYDAASQRTKETASVGVRKFGYDEKRQLTSVARVTGSDEVPDPTHQYGFTYDPIGNRQTATTNGASTSYTANNVNQYTQIAAATPAHDDNGNETTDGAGKTFEWDEENRLAAVVQGSTRSEYRYDGLSRRVEKRVYQDGQLTIHRRFLYDGWNLLAELTLTGPTETIERTYTWGLDLSLTPQGAGGVGGLLAAKDNTGAFSYHYDGNGNVTDLVDTDGAVTAHYEYGPFGEALRVTGSYAGQNPFRFSTKYADDETGLLYYGYRYYTPETGRWLSRDPIGEAGGMNLYGFCANDSANLIDPLGQDFIAVTASEVMHGTMHPIIVSFTGCPPELNKVYKTEDLLATIGVDVIASIDLMRSPEYSKRETQDWKIWRRVPGSRGHVGWFIDRVAISYIRYTTGYGNDAYVVFAGSAEKNGNKWDEITNLAKNYKYASQDPNSPQNWPYSQYSDPFSYNGLLPGNNSNTFMKYLTARAGLGSDWAWQLPGVFPGNSTPSIPTDRGGTSPRSAWPGQVPVPWNSPMPSHP